MENALFNVVKWNGYSLLPTLYKKKLALRGKREVNFFILVSKAVKIDSAEKVYAGKIILANQQLAYRNM